MRRVGRLVEIGGVAACAIRWRTCIAIGVALDAIGRQVRPRQREVR